MNAGENFAARVQEARRVLATGDEVEIVAFCVGESVERVRKVAGGFNGHERPGDSQKGGRPWPGVPAGDGDFLTDVRMRASNALTRDICANDPEADPADVHEDVREALWPFFEEIRERMEAN